MAIDTPVKKIPRHARRILEMAETDTQLQELMPDARVTEALRTPGLLYEEIIRVALDGFPTRPALGERAYDVAVDPSTGHTFRRLLPRFETITYRQLHDRVKALAEVWRRHPVHRVEAGDFVCIFGFAGTDFVTVDMAIAYARATSVPLQTTLAGSDLDKIMIDTEPRAIAATMSDLALAAKFATEHPSIRSIIAMDHDPLITEDRDRYEAAAALLADSASRAQLIPLEQLVADGDADAWEPYPRDETTPERIALLVHSSGSTGTPKGAIFLDRNSTYQYLMLPPVEIPIVRLVFAPLNHSLGRGQVSTALARGGTAYFTARSDLTTVFEDFRLVRPTESAMFPRLLEMIYRHYLGELVRAIEGGQDPDEAKAQIMEKMRTSFLGDRMVLMTSAGAPTTPELEQFIEECFELRLYDGYGNTESGSVTVSNRISRPPVIDYKLRDVPELGYFGTDAPYPRGELVVKTTTTVPGYFKNPEATAALFDSEGYLRTGDIMEEHGPDHLVYIDRRNDVMKLSQGEYVTCGAIGVQFESYSDVIAQAYVYGNAARAYLLAVIVPDMRVVHARLGDDPPADRVKALIRSELSRVGSEQHLRSFEIPRDFIIEMEPFSHENGLLSSVLKKMRPRLQHRYGEALEQLYVAHDRRQQDELAALRRTDSGLTTLQKVGKAVEAVLSLEDFDPLDPSNFTEIGGDSLAASTLSTLLTDICGVDVPVGSILSPAGNAQEWARSIERARDGSSFTQRTFAQIHGEGARELHADSLDIVNFLSDDIVREVATDEPPVTSSTVLVTGATGFLGRFLCLEWLERVADVGGRVVCLVHARDEATAAARFREAFSGDPALEERVDELAAKHLEILAGDVVQPRLGLDDATYTRLAGEVDRIVHPAAFVNHVLSYEDMFAPNVAGTAELIALALHTRQKRFDFVSSIAAASFVDRSAGNNERSPLRQTIELSVAYSKGYGATKWASEQILHSAHRRFGLPVNVFRGDMMLPHSRFAGQINVPDVFVRLLASMVNTGLAPRSFYELDAHGARVRAHYDGLPVDFVAGAVAGIGDGPNTAIRTYNMLNHHVDDGVSLDSIADWIETAGYPIERVAEHRDWISRFEARLKAMPEARRAQSSLQLLDPLRHAYPAEAAMPGSGQFVEAVRHIPAGPEIPHISESFIHKCLADLRAHDLIPAPSTAV